MTRQVLRARLLDELRVDLMPVLPGTVLRLFDDGDLETVELDKIDVQDVGARKSLHFRVKR